ncbi:MAG: hypothetical protein R2875_01285 [Desulfobacterales bacterium]
MKKILQIIIAGFKFSGIIAAAFEQSGRDIRDYNDMESLDESISGGPEATRSWQGLQLETRHAGA